MSVAKLYRTPKVICFPAGNVERDLMGSAGFRLERLRLGSKGEAGRPRGGRPAGNLKGISGFRKLY
jgi:hypothetical protein